MPQSLRLLYIIPVGDEDWESYQPPWALTNNRIQMMPIGFVGSGDYYRVQSGARSPPSDGWNTKSCPRGDDTCGNSQPVKTSVDVG